MGVPYIYYLIYVTPLLKYVSIWQPRCHIDSIVLDFQTDGTWNPSFVQVAFVFAGSLQRWTQMQQLLGHSPMSKFDSRKNTLPIFKTMQLSLHSCQILTCGCFISIFFSQIIYLDKMYHIYIYIYILLSKTQIICLDFTGTNGTNNQMNI